MLFNIKFDAATGLPRHKWGIACPDPQANGGHRRNKWVMMKLYDPEQVWEALLPLIASGQSLPAALAQLPEPRPSTWWCKKSLRDNLDLAERYRTAQEDRADVLADQIVEVANEPMPAGLRGADASAWVQRQRLRFDALRWTASKLRPRSWGDRVDVEVKHTQISIIAALEAAERRVIEMQREEDTSRA
jgi:hypothetical protein